MRVHYQQGLCVAVGLMTSTVVVAQTGTGSPAVAELLSPGYVAQVLGSLVLVFVLLFGLLFVMRKVNGMQTRSGRSLQVVESTSVGPREKIVLMRAGGRHFLVGVAQGHVTPLHTFDADAEFEAADANAVSGPDFSALLASAKVWGSNK